MRSIDIAVRPGDVFEVWLKGQGGGPIVQILAGQRLCWKVLTAPPHFVHHRYETFEDGPLTLTWDETAGEISLAYFYRPETVSDEGVTFIRADAGGLSLHGAPEMDGWYAREVARPAAHFSPFLGWMNDPNGSCFHEGRYHLFYQFHPNSTVWGPMHWGHAVSRDLVTWRHLPVFLCPTDALEALGASGGMFSGSALVEGDRLSFYVTERRPTYAGVGVFHEVQQRVEPDARVLGPLSVRTVLDRQPEGSAHDFRDPKVWRVADGYRMIIGSAMDGDPAVLMFASPDGLSWTYHSVLYRLPPRFLAEGGVSSECPDFFRIGERWVLICGVIGHKEPESGRRNLTFGLVGRFENDTFTPDGDLQVLDFGTDFYALQTFAAGERQLAFAWTYNWATGKPAGSVYSGEMSLPREVRIDADGAICLPVAPEAERLRGAALDLDAITGGAFVLALSGLSGLSVELRSGEGRFVVREENGALAITSPDDGETVYRSRPVALREVTIHFDRGLLEVTANGGAINGTRRSYRVVEVTSVVVTGAADVKGWALRSAW